MSTFHAVIRGLHPRRLGLALLFSLGLPLAAQAQSTTACGAEVKEAVVKELDAASKQGPAALAKAQATLYEKLFKECGASDAANIPADDPFFVAARQCGAKVAYTGSLFYEEMPCCGYDPQRRTFACPVKIKQNFGFGTAYLPGSREYVLHCVADATGAYLPVGDDSVHLSNSTLAPTWQFAVVANANDNLMLVQPMNAQARRARSILSWNFPPTGCNYQPIWGNVIDYRIRLNQ